MTCSNNHIFGLVTHQKDFIVLALKFRLCFFAAIKPPMLSVNLHKTWRCPWPWCLCTNTWSRFCFYSQLKGTIGKTSRLRAFLLEDIMHVLAWMSLQVWCWNAKSNEKLSVFILDTFLTKSEKMDWQMKMFSKLQVQVLLPYWSLKLYAKALCPAS